MIIVNVKLWEYSFALLRFFAFIWFKLSKMLILIFFHKLFKIKEGSGGCFTPFQFLFSILMNWNSIYVETYWETLMCLECLGGGAIGNLECFLIKNRI